MFRSSAFSETNAALYICYVKCPFHLEFQIYRHKSIYDTNILKIFPSTRNNIHTFLLIKLCICILFHSTSFLASVERGLSIFKNPFKEIPLEHQPLPLQSEHPPGLYAGPGLHQLRKQHFLTGRINRALFWISILIFSFLCTNIFLLISFVVSFLVSETKFSARPFKSFIFNKIIKRMNFTLSAALASSHKFWYIFYY